MIDLIIAWTILLITFIAYGNLTVFLWKKVTKTSEQFSYYDKFWLGMAFLGALCMYISLFAPLSIFVLLIILIYPTIFFIINNKVLTNELKQYFIKFNKLSYILRISFSLIILTIFIYSLYYPTLYDLGLYHLQTMSWAEQYPVIKGLGNLHGRLAFNSSGLLLNTLFNYHPTYFKTFFPINSLSLIIFSLWIFTKIVSENNLKIRLALIFVLVLVIFEFGNIISSTSTDFLPQLIIISLLLKWIFSLLNNVQIPFLKSRQFLIITLTAFCLTLKLSAVVIILVLALSFYYTIREKKYKIASVMFLLGLLFATPWLIRFVILSGYLIYPYPNIDLFSFDWKMPIHLVELERDLAYTWARLPHLDINEVKAMNFWQWFPLWVRRIYKYWVALYLLGIFTCIYSIFKYWNKKKLDIVYISMICLSGIIFNLFTAPDLRFVLGFIVISLITPLCFSSSQINKDSIVKYSFLIFSLCLFYKGISSLNFKLKDIFIMAKYDFSSSENFNSYIIDDKTFYYPQISNKCFDKELPCLPSINNNIELRNKDLSDGFRSK